MTEEKNLIKTPNVWGNVKPVKTNACGTLDLYI